MDTNIDTNTDLFATLENARNIADVCLLFNNIHLYFACEIHKMMLLLKSVNKIRESLSFFCFTFLIPTKFK